MALEIVELLDGLVDRLLAPWRRRAECWIGDRCGSRALKTEVVVGDGRLVQVAVAEADRCDVLVRRLRPGQVRGRERIRVVVDLRDSQGAAPGDHRRRVAGQPVSSLLGRVIEPVGAVGNEHVDGNRRGGRPAGAIRGRAWDRSELGVDAAIGRQVRVVSVVGSDGAGVLPFGAHVEAGRVDVAAQDPQQRLARRGGRDRRRQAVRVPDVGVVGVGAVVARIVDTGEEMACVVPIADAAGGRTGGCACADVARRNDPDQILVRNVNIELDGPTTRGSGGAEPFGEANGAAAVGDVDPAYGRRAGPVRPRAHSIRGSADGHQLVGRRAALRAEVVAPLKGGQVAVDIPDRSEQTVGVEAMGRAARESHDEVVPRDRAGGGGVQARLGE